MHFPVCCCLPALWLIALNKSVSINCGILQSACRATDSVFIVIFIAPEAAVEVRWRKAGWFAVTEDVFFFLDYKLLNSSGLNTNVIRPGRLVNGTKTRKENIVFLIFCLKDAVLFPSLWFSCVFSSMTFSFGAVLMNINDVLALWCLLFNFALLEDLLLPSILYILRFTSTSSTTVRD